MYELNDELAYGFIFHIRSLAFLNSRCGTFMKQIAW